MKEHGLAWIALAALVCAYTVNAVGADLPPMKIEKYELPNGLDVILHEDHATPRVTVNVWYHVGSKNEKPGRTGFAHLFEHMMFQGSAHHDTDFFAPLEKVGADLNGSTTEDRTNYFETVPSNYLELALWLEADRMGFLIPAMTQAKLDNQRDVVKNERRQGLDNQPYSKSYELMLPLQYPKDHPYNWPVIGSMEDLSAASLDDVKDFFKLYYTPNNASLVIAGDFDPATAKGLVEKYFAAIPPGRALDRMETYIPKLRVAKRGMAEDNVNLPRVYYSWNTPPMYAPGDAELSLLGSVLASGKTSRLYKALVYDQQIAQDVYAGHNPGEVSGSFDIYVTAREGHTLDEIERAVDAELQKVLTKGITPAELAAAQAAREASFVRRLEDIGQRADLINNYNVFVGAPDEFAWDMDRYMKVTVADVAKYAKDYIGFDNRVIFQIVPQGTLAAATDQTDRTKEPPGMVDPKFTAPTIQKDKLGNGLEIWLVENHNLPLVQANLVIKSGWAADPANRPGAGSLTGELLDEGTSTRNALQISDEAKSIGANFGSRSSVDGSTVSLNVLKKHLDRGLALMADVVLHPTFPSDELERQRQMYLGRILQEAKQPFTAGLKTFLRTLYGPEHPYGQPYTGSGTEQSIKAITRDDLVKFYQANYFPNNAALLVVGDMAMADAKAAAQKAFGSWPSGAVAQKDVPDPAPLTTTKVVIVDKPNAPQSVVCVGHLGLRRNAADFLAADVMNNAFGGQFTSRINMNLREDKGYTYGAGAFFRSNRGAGPFICYAQVQTPNTKDAIVEMVKEMRDIVGPRPLTDAELTDSKNNMIKGFPSGFSSIGATAGGLGEIYLYGLPADEWQTYTSRVQSIDGAMATKAAKDHLKPNELLIVVVGDRSQIEAGIKALNLGDVLFVDAASL